MKSFAFAKNLNLKRLLLIAVVVLATSLQGCAAGLGGAYEHQLGYCHMGDKTLIYKRIEYGQLIWPGAPTETNASPGGRNKNCLGGASFTGQMPVPEIMTVEWQTIDGPRHRVSIPIRAKLNPKHPMTSIDVRFNDEHVQVLQIYLNGLQPYKNASTIIFEQ